MQLRDIRINQAAHSNDAGVNDQNEGTEAAAAENNDTSQQDQLLNEKLTPWAKQNWTAEEKALHKRLTQECNQVVLNMENFANATE